MRPMNVEHALLANSDLLLQALDACAYPVWITNLEGVIEYSNHAQQKLCGYDREELQGASDRLFLAGPTLQVLNAEAENAALNGAIWEGDQLAKHKSGDLYWQYLRITALKSNNVVSHYLYSAAEFSEPYVEQQRLEWVSGFDSLTALPNRPHFINQLNQAIQAATHTNQSMSLLHFDIDHFSVINEKYGESFADRILIIVGESLGALTWQGDVLSRISGDEFGLLLRNTALDEQHLDIAHQYLCALSDAVMIDGIPVELTFSIGVATFPHDGTDADTLLFSAATAKQAANKAGGNCVMFYHAVQGISKSARLDLIRELRNGINANELVLHYQPKVSLVSGEIVGFEALVRWNHPQRGLLPPLEFIPLAEDCGLIIALSEWVLSAACKQMAEWRTQGLPAVRVAVNLSARHFHQATLPESIAALLAQYKLDACQLELELTESMMMHDAAAAIAIVDQIKALGIHLSLDDFGTGYSSLAHLSRLSINAVKIDQSFVRDITSNPVNASIVQATIAMAHKLGMRVIAEGVETDAQRLFLQRNSCDEMQGYSFSYPVAAEQAGDMLRLGRRMESVSAAENDENLPTLLLVDDEPNIIRALRRIFRNNGYRILSTNSAETALEILALNRVNVIISDQRMPEMTGVELLSRVKELYPGIVRIILSGYSDINAVTDAINRGAIYKYFTKPWDDEDLREELRRIFLSLRA